MTPAGVAGAVALACAGLAGGCASPEPMDTTAFRALMPASILVLPAMNRSPEPRASSAYVATVTSTLAERGYYVFPVAVVESILREQGLPTAGEMHEVDVAKFGEHFGADAVLYLVVEDWGQSYIILSSRATVTVQARLVDTATGTTLWQGRGSMVSDSGDAGGGVIGMLANALLTQVIASSDGRSRNLAHQLNVRLYGDGERGLLRGPRHPEFGAETAQETP